MEELDLFGQPVQKKNVLRNIFGWNPFTILDAKDSRWQIRKNQWNALGIKSEVGREAKSYNIERNYKYGQGEEKKKELRPSIFDPVLCELMYRWYCPQGGGILDPFAGGSVRGIVANYLGYKYTGIDLREEQIRSNQWQGVKILDFGNQPKWICGDSNQILDSISDNSFDLVFSCPPYVDLEVYSDNPLDLSTMDYQKFMQVYMSIVKKSCQKLKSGGMAIFVVGEVRDKRGNYYGFVPDTHYAFRMAGMEYYNEAILATSMVNAAVRANGNMKSGKLVKIHQNILMFKKP